MCRNREFYLRSLLKQWNNFIFKILEMSSKMLKHRYFYPTKLFFAKYDIIVHDFSYICQIKYLKSKLLHFIFKLLEEKRKFKLECAFPSLYVAYCLYMCADTLTDEGQCGTGTRTLGNSSRFLYSHFKNICKEQVRGFLSLFSFVLSFSFGGCCFKLFFLSRNSYKTKEFKYFEN